jgi:SHS2 domain-containing protein
MQIMLKGNQKKQTLMQGLFVSGSDYADLMVRWLGEILYLFQGEKRLVNAIRIQDIQPYQLTAQIETVAFDPGLHEILYEIKAVTYHQIEVIQKDKQWHARVIFDI